MSTENTPAPNPQPDPSKPAGNKPGEQPPADPDKLTLTKAELQRQIDAALEAERAKARKQADAEREEAERKKAEEQGEFQKVAESERKRREEAEQRAAAAELAAKGRDVDMRIVEYLAEHHPDYPASVAKYVKPQVAFATDTADDELAKRVKAAADQYVTDNPRKVGTGAPAPVSRTGPRQGTFTPKPQNRVRHSAGVAASRW